MAERPTSPSTITAQFATRLLFRSAASFSQATLPSDCAHRFRKRSGSSANKATRFRRWLQADTVFEVAGVGSRQPRAIAQQVLERHLQPRAEEIVLIRPE